MAFKAKSNYLKLQTICCGQLSQMVKVKKKKERKKENTRDLQHSTITIIEKSGEKNNRLKSNFVQDCTFYERERVFGREKRDIYLHSFPYTNPALYGIFCEFNLTQTQLIEYKNRNILSKTIDSENSQKRFFLYLYLKVKTDQSLNRNFGVKIQHCWHFGLNET